MAAPPGLHVTVRFTTSEPDLRLELPRPELVTVIALKQLIRGKLAPPTNTRRLRLIYSGKMLLDSAFLPSVLKIPPPPPKAPVDPKGKGKAVDSIPAPALVFVNCSIGDALTPAELLTEAEAAVSSVSSTTQTTNNSTNKKTNAPPSLTTTTPAPRGFDRLLSTGFTPAEVNQLRLQFLSIQSATHTPDTMPSPNSLRRLEDAWIDDNHAGGGGASTEEEVNAASGALDDLLWGLTIGFLWPLGAMAWLSREQGVWSARRQTAVWSGFVLCLGFGVMKLLG